MGQLKQLENNRQLYDYLTGLAAKLTTRGASELAGLVLAASRMSGGVPATEFLGESRIVLRRVLKLQTVLDENERLELTTVLDQLDSAFDEGG
jgi:hypothetical protein